MRILDTVAVLALVLLIGGCATQPEKKHSFQPPQAKYDELDKQTIGVMVWADFRTRVEYNGIQLHLAKAIQQKLAPEGEKHPPISDATFINPASLAKFQREHPEIETQSAAQVATRLSAATGMTRLIYIELEDFSSRSAASMMLLKGKASATLRVIEVDLGTRLAKVAFEERAITVGYPVGAPEGVIPTEKVDERAIYQGTLLELADALAARFVEIN